ncbi:uncharacterized protein LOC21397482 [Morus notabilis]|uniref:uncharacterized protein LOC21397482 n=1 Tax=Morus notabilis TaxID=981085 RepID=UPI000CED3D52|nr:uncharacterized protein LOC21397482 [Morus notabilis]
MTPSRRSTLIALPTPPRRRLKSSAFFGVRNRVQHRLGQRLLHPDCPVWLRVRAVLRLLASASPLHLLLLVNRFAPKDSGFRLYLIRNLAILSIKKGAYLLKCGRRGSPSFVLSGFLRYARTKSKLILGF